MAVKDVNIQFNYNNGSPTWSADPDPVIAPQGVDTINWHLLAGIGLPTGYDVKFDQSTGISFAAGSGWPGSIPAPVAGDPKQYTASDTNNTQGPDPVFFKYTTTYRAPRRKQEPDRVVHVGSRGGEPRSRDGHGVIVDNVLRSMGLSPRFRL